MADPYRSQVAPNVTALPGASPESFGAAAARGLEEAGGTIEHVGAQLKNRNRDIEAAAAGVELAQNSMAIDQAAIDGRSTAAPGGAGHTEAVSKLIDERTQKALANIKDPHLRAVFGERYAVLKDQIHGREYGWEAGARVDKLGNDFDDMGSTLANGQAANPDAVGLATSLDTVEATGHALSVPADLRDKLIKEQQRKVAVAWGNAMQTQNPHVLIGALEKGVLSHYLEPGDINTLRDGGMVEIRRQEAAARQAQNQAEAAARESVHTLLNKVTDGYTPTAEEWSAAQGTAKAFKLEGPEWDLGVAKGRADLNRESRDWTPSQWRSNINELEAKGDKRTAAEDVRLKQLHEAAGGAISRFNSDPFAAAAAAGNPAPNVDWSNPDPKAVESRVTWARSYARAAGLTDVPYLSVDETKTLRDRTAQGPAGQLEVASEVRNTFGIAAATEIVRQIDPNNKDMQIMVGLHPRMATLYSRGLAALKRDPKLAGVDAEDEQSLRDVFAEFAPGIPVDLQTPIWNAAKAMTAGRAAEVGKSELTGPELTDAFRAYLHRAGGMVGSTNEGSATGGFARWNGRYAWLPPSMSRDDFQRRISRADGSAWERAAGSAPYYQGADGKLVKMSDSQISHLGSYELETVNPGLYRMVAPDGGHVVDAQGRPWQFDIRKLAPSFDDQLAAHGYTRR